MNEEEINGNEGYAGFTQTPRESTPAVEDEPAKKQPVSSDSDIKFDMKQSINQ